jgi:Ala-tRNA(Pro) deacylase
MLGEEEMKVTFPDCEIGAEAPFGSQYGVKTFVDESLGETDSIVFRAGTHDQTVKISYADYEKLEQPAKGQFAAEPE